MTRETMPDVYTCDNCGQQDQYPLPPSWFEVSRPSPLVTVSDWWQEDRYFCSAACLRTRLHREEA